MQKNHFTIAIDCCEHEPYIERCLNSCLTQKHDNYDVILVDAVSSDLSFNIAKKYAQEFPNLKVYQNEVRLPQVANFLWLTQLAKPKSIIVSVDSDDYLKHKKILQVLDENYTEDVWMTYGSYQEEPYRDVSWHYHEYPVDIIQNNSFREYKWLGSHLRTWRKELFLKIKEENLKMPNGEWIITPGDQLVMLPMLEMSGFHSKFISDILYVYNVATTNQSRDTVLNEQKQIDGAKYIRSLPKYTPLESLE